MIGRPHEHTTARSKQERRTRSDTAAREAALRAENERLTTLLRVSQQLAAIHDFDEVLHRTCELATALTGAELGACYVRDDGEVKQTVCGAAPDEAAAIVARRDPPAALADIARLRSRLAVPVHGRGGEIAGGIVLGHTCVGAFDDATTQLLTGLAAVMATALDGARQFRDLDRFAYVTSHDLRAPLRGLANLATWIEEDLGDRLTDRGREHLALLRGRVHRLEDLIDGVLEYSRAARVTGDPVEINLGALVRDVVELVPPTPPARVVIAPDLPMLSSPRVPLQQVLMNLIGNALAHGGPEVVVEIGALPSDHGWEVFVRDNGPGIEPRDQAHIWGLFHTLRSRDQRESTGIGLAIVRKIVEAHGGRAWVESEPGRGATFRFTWPKTPPRSRSWR